MTKRFFVYWAMAGLLFGIMGRANAQVKRPDGHVEHSRLYNGYNDKSLRELAASDAPAIGVKIGPPMPFVSSTPSTFTVRDFLGTNACAADVIMVGAVRSMSASLTEDEHFVFSEYQMHIEVILKSGPMALETGGQMTVVRPGGTVLIDGKSVSAIDTAYEPLLPGQKYLLFLKLIPKTGAYAALNSQTSFRIRGDKATELTSEALPRALRVAIPADELADQVRDALAGCTTLR